MDSPPSKRTRTESDPDRIPVTRSNIWYSDRSVVLHAEATQFRVHTSILSGASTVFRDMFEVARSPANTDSQVDGCPLVHMYDDTAKDVQLVLEALTGASLSCYLQHAHGTSSHFYKTEEKQFAQVAAMWWLGKKYGFEELRGPPTP
ncbi:hypothetical protein DFH07DRAFT_740975 [Mycena maculata]|uniref:BTB domain-containing protein n=1 Tax=Mycena maculata TaxID=230809 RepID=A0AAD7J8X0_9AGAR|nr:hypothetical protein DFH07DRAFT_740975 [Mycena maculata]